jgi:hypothetical protein
MQDSESLESTAASTPPQRSTHLFYTIKTKGGFVSANTSPEGPPISLVPNPNRATRFTEEVTARRRAAALEHMGWRDLSIFPFEISNATPS